MADLETLRDHTMQYYQHMDLPSDDEDMAVDPLLQDVLIGKVEAPTSHAGEWEDIMEGMQEDIKPCVHLLILLPI